MKFPFSSNRDFSKSDSPGCRFFSIAGKPASRRIEEEEEEEEDEEEEEGEEEKDEANRKSLHMVPATTTLNSTGHTRYLTRRDEYGRS